MSDIKETRTEVKGTNFNEQVRTTSETDDGRVGVSEWHDTKAEAVQESRERAANSEKKDS